ncbi:MAG: diacylglycerol/polyprenol kinase family protein [Candidatus Bathyarchaeia archaeon]
MSVIFTACYLRRGVLSPWASRKFLHSMIGNLPLIMPFFTRRIFPLLVSITFIVVTFLVTPYSPLSWLRRRMGGLSDITGEGHNMGLVLYAISYSVLAYLFGTRPYIVAAGIFPMAYGDSTATLIGMRYGNRRIGGKSLEGCVGMFIGSLVSLTLGMGYFSFLYGFSLIDQVFPISIVALFVTLLELISPDGLDNLFVPILGALTFVYLGGGT